MSSTVSDPDTFNRSLYDSILVRYGELALKGRNRPLFEKQLAANVKRTLRGIDGRPERHWGRLFVKDVTNVHEAIERLTRVFGLVSVSPVVTVSLEMEAIFDAARRVMTEVVEARESSEPLSYKVEARRSDKTFPLDSMELNREVGSTVGEALEGRVRVDLYHPEVVLGLEVRTEAAYLFARRIPGPGGLPVGTVGKVISLLSGGIDSPVASYLAMKRGCHVVFAHFHSAAFVGQKSLLKVMDLARELARWQPYTRLVVFPFAEIQKEIRRGAPEAYRTVLFRRMMQRITDRLRREEDAGAIVTGESLGQVASQTLTNLHTIARAGEAEVLRPLITYDKEEVIALAERIGTYEISVRPHEDCCTVFQPKAPATKSRPRDLETIECGLEWEELVEQCYADREAHDF